MSSNVMPRSASSPALYAITCAPELQNAWFTSSPSSISLQSPRAAFSLGAVYGVTISPRFQPVTSRSPSQSLCHEPSATMMLPRASGLSYPNLPHPEKRPSCSASLPSPGPGFSVCRVNSADDIWPAKKSRRTSHSPLDDNQTSFHRGTGLERATSCDAWSVTSPDELPSPLKRQSARLQFSGTSAQGTTHPHYLTSENAMTRQSSGHRLSLPQCEAIEEEEQNSQPSVRDSIADAAVLQTCESQEITREAEEQGGVGVQDQGALLTDAPCTPEDSPWVMGELVSEPPVPESTGPLPCIHGLGAQDSAFGGLLDGSFCSTESPATRHPEVTEDYYGRALADDPENALLLRNYARFLQQVKGNFLASEQVLERAIVSCPGDADVLVQYAKLVWEFRRDADRAMMYFERAVQASPDDCYVLAAYASFLWSLDSSTNQPPSDPHTGLLSPTPV